MPLRSVCSIPVYNQARQLPKLLERIKAADIPYDEIIIINDGSNDGSTELIHQSGFRYIDIPENRGAGNTIITAAKWAMEHDFDILGGMAGNSKMLPEEMPRILGPVLRDEADYVKGSRYLEGGCSPDLPRFRSMAIPAVTWAVNLIAGTQLTDLTAGFRAFRLDLLRQATFQWDAEWLKRYGFEQYFLAKVLLAENVRAIEAPITMKYPKTGSYSKIRPFVDWFDILKPWFWALTDRQTIIWPPPK